MQNLVHPSGYIKSRKFIFKGKKYEVIATGIGKTKSVWNSIDTVKREDGMKRNFIRLKLREYFNEVDLKNPGINF